jgi:hypothetical protein
VSLIYKFIVTIEVRAAVPNSTTATRAAVGAATFLNFTRTPAFAQQHSEEKDFFKIYLICFFVHILLIVTDIEIET